MEINANRAEKLADSAERIIALGHVIYSITDGADERTQKGIREVAWEMVKEANAIKEFFALAETDGGEAEE